jgi:Mrp family chromosome partitioning ATPase
VNKAWQVSEEAGDTFETLRHRVLQALKPGSSGTVVLGVTSCHLGEGTTFVATNLAITLARYAEDSQVLYVDASQHVRSRREGDSKLLGASELQANEQGDVNVVERNLYTVQPPDAVKPSSVPAKTAKAYDHLVPLIRQRNYSFVVVDIPPLNEGIASLRLGGPLDAVILVIETEKVRWEAARWGLELLQGANANILGAVLNKRRLHIPEWIYRRL